MNSTSSFSQRTDHLSRFETAPRLAGMYQVTHDIAGLRTAIVNVYFLGAPEAANWVLVDAGMAGSAARIVQAAEERFGPGARPQAIILTHGHFDHIGALRTLAEKWNVPVYAHPLELPYLAGRSSYPPADPIVGGGIMPFLAVFFPRSPIDLGERVQPLPNDGSVPGAPGWRWHHTPGHTPGHVSFFREEDRALIVGDAFITVNQESLFAILAQRPELHGPPKYFTPDWQSARASVQHLASMHPKIVATGHGIPLRGEAMERDLQALARDFDVVALPTEGRYVDEPAVANLHGVVSVPPRRWNAATVMLLAGGAALVGLALARGCCTDERRRWRG